LRLNLVIFALLVCSSTECFHLLRQRYVAEGIGLGAGLGYKVSDVRTCSPKADTFEFCRQQRGSAHNERRRGNGLGGTVKYL
jgi:hypothetical protein